MPIFNQNILCIENCDNILEDLCQEEVTLECILEFIKQIFQSKNMPKLLTILMLIYIIIISISIKISYNKKSIHIAINIDKKYFYPCIVFLTSLLDNQNPDTYYSIHVLTGKDITGENMKNFIYKKIRKLIKNKGKNYSNIKIKFYDLGEDFNCATHGKYISVADYYRIALPSLLPIVDKIIYIDTDVINFKDLSEMYSIELKDDIFFMGTLDDIGLLSELKHIKNLTKYMNAGILIMNLRSLRKYGIEEKIREYVFTHFLNHHDQTAINAVCHDHLGILSIKYATFTYDSFEELVAYNKKQNKKYRYSKGELKKAFYEPTLLHFVGWVKPWHKGYKNINKKYWWYYAKKSGFYKEILKYYNFKEKYVDKLIKKIPKDGGLLRRNYKKVGLNI